MKGIHFVYALLVSEIFCCYTRAKAKYTYFYRSSHTGHMRQSLFFEKFCPVCLLVNTRLYFNPVEMTYPTIDTRLDLQKSTFQHDLRTFFIDTIFLVIKLQHLSKHRFFVCGGYKCTHETLKVIINNQFNTNSLLSMNTVN